MCRQWMITYLALAYAGVQVVLVDHPLVEKAKQYLAYVSDHQAGERVKSGYLPRFKSRITGWNRTNGN